MNDIKGTKVLISTSSFAESDQLPLERLKNAGCLVRKNPFRRRLSQEELIQLLSEGAAGLIAGVETLNRVVLSKSTLKVISRCGSGLSNVDLTAAEELGIKIFSTPQAPVTAVAELTVGCLISLLRQIPAADSLMHERKWQKLTGCQLEGKKIAIIGFGRIGRKVAKALSGFGVCLMAVDPAHSDKVDDIPIVGLDEALKEADIVLLHASGNHAILAEPEFRLMKEGVYLLNAARGELVDEEALIVALESGRVKGAWLDTFAQEPYTGRLCDYKQVILTPHIGSYTDECRRQMELEAVENLLRGLQED